MNLLHAAGDPHEHEAPFLFELVGLIEAALVRTDPILHGHEVDHREFESLGGMERHQRDPIGGGVPGVGVGHQGGGVEERAERGFVDPAGLFIRGISGIELPGRRDQFLYVREPVVPLLILVVGEHGAIAGLLEHGFEDPGHRGFAGRHARERGMERGKPTDRRGSPGREAGHRLRPSAGGEEWHGMVGRPGREEIERQSPDAPRGHVDDPEERLVIARIPQQSQPGDDVTDLASLEELDPAEQLVGDAAGTERDLQGAGEGVGAEEDREIPW